MLIKNKSAPLRAAGFSLLRLLDVTALGCVIAAAVMAVIISGMVAIGVEPDLKARAVVCAAVLIVATAAFIAKVLSMLTYWLLASICPQRTRR